MPRIQQKLWKVYHYHWWSSLIQNGQKALRRKALTAPGFWLKWKLSPCKNHPTIKVSHISKDSCIPTVDQWSPLFLCSSSSVPKSRFYLPGTMFLKRSPSFPAPRPWTQVGPSPYVKGFYCFVPWWWIASLLPSYGKQLLLPHRPVWVDIQPLLDQSEIFPRIYQIGSKENVPEPLEARICELGTNGSHASNLLGKAPLKD